MKIDFPEATSVLSPGSKCWPNISQRKHSKMSISNLPFCSLPKAITNYVMS